MVAIHCQMLVLLAANLLLCTLPGVSSKLAASTSNPNIHFSSYNIFVDTSEAGTDLTLRSLSELPSPKSTTPSLQDSRDFALLQPKYVYFNGQAGVKATREQMVTVQYPFESDKLWDKRTLLSQWTFGIWFMLRDELPWNLDESNYEKSRVQTLIELEMNSLEGQANVVLTCQIHNNQGELKCFNEVADRSMTLNLKDYGLEPDLWYFLVVDSEQNRHRIQIFDQSWEQKGQTTRASSGFISLANMDLRLGMSLYGAQPSAFKGSLRHFTFFQEQFLNDQQLKNIAFQYLYPTSNRNLLLELPLSDASDAAGLVEQVNNFQFRVFGNESSQKLGLVEHIDDSPNWHCFHEHADDVQDIQRFQSIHTNFKQYKLDEGVYFDINQQGSFRTKLHMWIYRQSLDSTRGEAYVKEDGSIFRQEMNQVDPNYFDEVLFEHEGIVKLEFQKKSNDFLTVTNFDDNDDQRTVKVFVPRAQWVWISCVHHEDYFSVYVRDYFGRVLHSQSKQIAHAQRPNYKTSRNVQIANNYYGYVKGIKYYKDDSNLGTDVQYFTDEADSTGNLLLFFNFEKKYFDMQDQSFQNLAKPNGRELARLQFNDVVFEVNEQDQEQYIGRKIEIYNIFDRMPTPKDETTSTGHQYNDVVWDGATCIFEKQNVLLTRDSELSMPIEAGSAQSPLSALHIQFWLRMNTTQGLFKYQEHQAPSYSADLVQLKKMDIGDSSPIIEVRIKEGALECVLHGGASPDSFEEQRVEFPEFNFISPKWQHVSCWVEGFDTEAEARRSSEGQGRNEDWLSSKNLLMGSLYSDGQRFDHYHDTSLLTFQERKQQFFNNAKIQFSATALNLTVQGPKSIQEYSNAGVIVQDLRIWRRVLTPEERRYQRYQENYGREKQADLVVDAPLLEGLHYPYKLFNFANGKSFFTRGLTLVPDLSNKNDKPNPIVCPHGYIYDYSQNNCVLDIIKKPQSPSGALVRGKAEDDFQVRLDDLLFRHNQGLSYYRDISEYITEKKWKIKSLSNFDSNSVVKLQIESQQYQNVLTISTDSMDAQRVANMQLELSVYGDHYRGSEVALTGINFNLNLNPCMRFHDRATGHSFIDQELEFEQNSVDFSFEYEVEDCEAMRFDRGSLKFQMIQNEQQPFDVDAVQISDNRLTIPRNYLGFIPKNQHFFFITKGTFRSADGSRQQELSIIFQLRWLTQLSLPVSDYKVGVPYNSDLVLDGSSAGIINADNSLGLTYNVSWTWICPTCFNCQGMTQDDGRRLVMKNISLESACGDWGYLKPFDFTLQVRSGFVGLDGRAFIQRKFGVTWLGPPPSVEISYPTVNSLNQPLNIEIADAEWLNFVEILWTLEGTDRETNDAVQQLYSEKDSYFLNSDQRRIFVIAKDSFSKMGTYRFRLKLYSAEFKGVLVYEADRTFFMAEGPHGGDFSVDRLEGPALLYEFTLTAENWQSYVEPGTLKYQYFYRKDEDRSLTALSDEAVDLRLIKTRLPETSLLYLHVTDALGGISKRGIYVRIYLNEESVDPENIKQSLENQAALIQDRKLYEGLNELQAWTETISKFRTQLTQEELIQTGKDSLNVVEMAMQNKDFLQGQQQEFVLEKSQSLMEKILTYQGQQSAETLDSVDQWQRLINAFQKEESSLVKLIQQDETVATNMHYFIENVFAGLQDYSFRQDNATSEVNETVKSHVGALRNQLLNLDKSIGQGVVDGQVFEKENSDILMKVQKISNQENENKKSLEWNQGKYRLKFPMEQVQSSSPSLSLAFIVVSNQPNQAQIEAHDEKMQKLQEEDEAWKQFLISNNVETADSLKAKWTNLTQTLPMPDTYVNGGLFSASNLTQQRLVSNDTFYVTVRDQSGGEVRMPESNTNAKVELTFQINITDYILSTFSVKQKTGLRCGYLPVESTNISRFETDLCETTLTDEKQEIIYSTNGWQPHPQPPEIADLLNGQTKLTVSCLCSHMSYYVLVEEIGDPELPEPSLNFDTDIRQFKDWAAFGIGAYLLILFLALVLYTRAKDMEQWLNLMSMEEKDDMTVMQTLEDGASENVGKAQLEEQEAKPGCCQDPVTCVTLINMIFQRKLAIEPYCLAVQLQDNKPKTSSLSTWQLFKIFIQHLHPFFSIIYRFDISLSRVDRVLFLLTRIILCALICHFGVGSLRLMTFAEYEIDRQELIVQIPTDDMQQFTEFTFDELFGSDELSDARSQVLFTLIACLIVMLPVPYWVFDGCRTKYILKNRVLSKDVDLAEEEDDSMAMQSEHLEGGSQTHASKAAMSQHERKVDGNDEPAPADLNDQHDLGLVENKTPNGAGRQGKQSQRKQAPIQIDPQWPISTLMRISEVPFQLLQQHAMLFNYEFTHINFKETLRALQWLAQQESADISTPLPQQFQQQLLPAMPQPVEQPNGGSRVNRLEAAMDQMADGELPRGAEQEPVRQAEPKLGHNTVELTTGHLDTTQRYLLDQTVVKTDNFALSNLKDNAVQEQPKYQNPGSQDPPAGLIGSHTRSRQAFMNNGSNEVGSSPAAHDGNQTNQAHVRRNSQMADEEDEVKVEQSDAEAPMSPKIANKFEGGEEESVKKEGGQSELSRASKKSPLSTTSKRKTNMRYSNHDVEEDEISFDDNRAAPDETRFGQGSSGMGVVQQSGAFVIKSGKHSDFKVSKQAGYLSGEQLTSPGNLNIGMGVAPGGSGNFNFKNSSVIQKAAIRPFNDEDDDAPGEIMDDMSDEQNDQDEPDFNKQVHLKKVAYLQGHEQEARKSMSGGPQPLLGHDVMKLQIPGPGPASDIQRPARDQAALDVEADLNNIDHVSGPAVVNNAQHQGIEEPASRIEYLQDEFGNIIQVEDISAQFNAGIMGNQYFEAGDYPPTFVDERKFLQAKSHACARSLGRLSMVVVNLLMVIVFLMVYSKDKNYLVRNASLASLIVFMAAQLISILIVNPLLILIYSVLFLKIGQCCASCCAQSRQIDGAAAIDDKQPANPLEVLQWARSGYPKNLIDSLSESANRQRHGKRRMLFLQRLMPLSFQLFTDYLELSEQMKFIRRKSDKNIAQEIVVEKLDK